MNPGTTISHYRVTDQLGRGGMGIVYKAEDTKLDRTVALKLLPPHALASDDDRARFYREARAAAALNHPNIAHVYEIDESEVEGESRPFIAMEYIDGEALSDRVARGPLPLKDAVSIATQIAEGLKAAHEKNIVHRDVKSGNIMLTSSGVPKILDFGLAKTAASTKLTQMGSTLGTVAYMSPEQAKGEEVDRRSDVWSLGVILYEMVSGRMPFPGDYEQAIVYGILNAEPEPLTAIRTGVPMELERIVNKCLTKDSARRYQSTTDLVVDLAGLQVGDSQASGQLAQPDSVLLRSSPGFQETRDAAPRYKRRAGYSWIAAALGGIVLGALGMWFAGPTGETGSSIPMSTDLVLPEGVILEAYKVTPLQIDRVAVDIDRDGRNVVFAGGADESVELYIRSLETGDTKKLEGTKGAYGPFFSPDGQWVAFFAGNRLKKIGVAGGTVVDLAEASLPYGGSWGPDGRIVYSNNECESLAVVPEDGGVRRIVSTGRQCVTSPIHVGSDGSVLVRGNDDQLLLFDIDSGDISSLGVETHNVDLVGSDVLVISREGQLFALRFDPKHLQDVGAPVQIQGGVLHDNMSQFALSRSGTLVYANGPWLGKDRLAWLYEGGRIEVLTQFEPQRYSEFSLSPSADRIAISVYERPLQTLWVYDFERGSRIRLTSDGIASGTAWTPDGRSIAYRLLLGGNVFALARSAEGIGAVDTLAVGEAFVEWFTPDGRRLAMAVPGANGIPDIVIRDLDPSARVETVSAEPGATEVLSEISPDGRFVAYTSDQTGDYQVYVQPFPPTGERWQVSVAGGEEPVWTEDGSRLFYRVGDYLMSVNIRYVGATPRFSVPDTVFAGQFSNVPGYSYDYDDANRRWLILRQAETRPPIRHLRVVSDLRPRIEDALARQSL